MNEKLYRYAITLSIGIDRRRVRRVGFTLVELLVVFACVWGGGEGGEGGEGGIY